MKQTILCIVSAVFVCLVASACNTVPSLPLLPPDATILAFGDSLTYGTGAAETESYPAELSRLTAKKVINSGVPGEVSSAGVQRLAELLDREKPALMILCHGGNDLLGRHDQQQLEDNLGAMVRLARERGVAVLLVAVPSPDLLLKPPKLYDDVAKKFSIPIERKILPHILGKGSLKSDHIHPNAAGYKNIAKALAELLKKSGALP